MNLSVTGANVSQTLFKQNEHSVVPSDSVATAFQNLSSLSGINSMSQQLNNMHSQMPAFLDQAHMSTWYQDNPWETLTYTKKFGTPPMGGNIDPHQPPGYKPGNVLAQPVLRSEGFENASIKITWQ